MSELSLEEVLRWIPHQRPFRFIDRVIELSDDHVLASYHYRSDEFFYAGHMPGRPITPGVILTETMVQSGMLPLGIRLLAREEPEPQRWITALTEIESEYYRPVLPDTTVLCCGTKVYWRRRKLKARLELTDEHGTLLATATAAGIAVPRIAIPRSVIPPPHAAPRTNAAPPIDAAPRTSAAPKTRGATGDD